MEASSRGCATIISNKGGLPETITNGIILNDSNEQQLYDSIKKLISDNSYRKKLCFLSHKNFKNDYDKSQMYYQKLRLKRVNRVQNSSKQQAMIYHASNPIVLGVRNFLLKNTNITLSRLKNIYNYK